MDPIICYCVFYCFNDGFDFSQFFPQIVSSIAISILLIFSAMFFKSVGRDRESKRNDFDASKSDSEFK